MKRQSELTPRLRLLADWVPQGAAFADVGTDHGCLPARLLLDGRVRSAIASDLRSGPLYRAKETARSWGAEGVRFRLCDGLSGIRPEEADVIAIAGLGGENIAAILSRAPWTADGCHTLLLQPMTRAEVLRRYLAGHGYAIRREALALDRGILYPVMEVVAGQMSLTPGQEYGGAALLGDPLGDRYLIETILRLLNAVAGLNHAARCGGGEDLRNAEVADSQQMDRPRLDSQQPDRQRSDSQQPDRQRSDSQQMDRQRSDSQQMDRQRSDSQQMDRPRLDSQQPDRPRLDSQQPDQPGQSAERQQALLKYREKADRLRDIITELLSMREEWRHANRAGS